MWHYIQSLLLTECYDPRKKVDAIVARGGGIPDRDAPLVLEETKFWCTVEESREDMDGVELLSCILKHVIHVCIRMSTLVLFVCKYLYLDLHICNYRHIYMHTCIYTQMFTCICIYISTPSALAIACSSCYLY